MWMVTDRWLADSACAQDLDNFVQVYTATTHYYYKQFVKQMSDIERCEAQIRHIRNINKLSLLSSMVQETVATTLDTHFHIRQSQNSPENLVNFLCKHSDDPAIKVSRILLESTPLIFLKNRTSFPSLSTFYCLKWRSFWFEKINFTWEGIWNPPPVQAWFLWKNKFTSQAIGFISTIWCNSTIWHMTSVRHKTLSIPRHLTATSWS